MIVITGNDKEVIIEVQKNIYRNYINSDNNSFNEHAK